MNSCSEREEVREVKRIGEQGGKKAVPRRSNPSLASVCSGLWCSAPASNKKCKPANISLLLIFGQKKIFNLISFFKNYVKTSFVAYQTIMENVQFDDEKKHILGSC
jgi:hypothetical protein